MLTNGGSILNTELIATTAIKKAIAKSNYLVPYINEADKAPSWDGFILAYKKPGDNHRKDDLAGRVDVQIKGKKCSDPNKEHLSYPVETADLRNYLECGGAFYLVVCFDESGENEVIYYNALLPYSLKKILKKHGEQKTYNITLNKLPRYIEKTEEIFLDFVTNARRQKAAIQAELVPLDTLICEMGKIPELFFEFNQVGNNYLHPVEALVGKDLYINAQLPYNISLPMQALEHIQYAAADVPVQICAGGRLFYDSVKITADEDYTEVFVGSSIKHRFHRQTHEGVTKISIHGTLSERIRDLEFILSAYEQKEITVHGSTLQVGSLFEGREKDFQYERRKSNLAFLKRAAQVLKLLGVETDLDCDKMKETDEINLGRLIYSVLDHNPISLNVGDSRFGTFRVANITLLMHVVKDEETGLFRLFNVLDTKIRVKGVMDDGTEFLSTYCVTLDYNALLKYDNLNTDQILERIKEVDYSEPFEIVLTLFLLEVLKAYDKRPDKVKFLNLAENILFYIEKKTEHPRQAIVVLNGLQIRKRRQDLSDQDICLLRDIITENQNDYSVVTGAYLLIGDTIAAKASYKKMSEKDKTEFDGYPITRFWECERES